MNDTTKYARIKVRGDERANWESNNPILLEREIGLTIDAEEIKVGDGVNSWLDLPNWITKNFNDLTNRPKYNGEYMDNDTDIPLVVTPEQSNWAQTDTEELSYILNKPDLADVATSGDYEDLINKPEDTLDGILEMQSDWEEDNTTVRSYIQNKPDLGTAAACDIEDFATAAQGELAESALQSVDEPSDIESYLVQGTLSTSNKLATVDFVNSSVSNMAGAPVFYDQEGNWFPTREALTSATVAYDRDGNEVTDFTNCYTMVEEDEDAPSPYTGGTTRWAWSGESIETAYYLYGVNMTPFTQAQLDAINSGWTSAKTTSFNTDHTKLAGIEAGAQVNEVTTGMLDNKVDKVTGKGLSTIDYDLKELFLNQVARGSDIWYGSSTTALYIKQIDSLDYSTNPAVRLFSFPKGKHFMYKSEAASEIVHILLSYYGYIDSALAPSIHFTMSSYEFTVDFRCSAYSPTYTTSAGVKILPSSIPMYYSLYTSNPYQSTSNTASFIGVGSMGNDEFIRMDLGTPLILDVQLQLNLSRSGIVFGVDLVETSGQGSQLITPQGSLTRSLGFIGAFAGAAYALPPGAGAVPNVPFASTFTDMGWRTNNNDKILKTSTIRSVGYYSTEAAALAASAADATKLCFYPED